MNKQGTEWVEPGQGATCGELLSRLLSEKSEPTVYAASQNLRLIYNPSGVLYDPCQGEEHHTPEACWHRSTNLRLTGEPLTAEDVKRIAEAK